MNAAVIDEEQAAAPKARAKGERDAWLYGLMFGLIGLAWVSEVVHLAGGPWPFTTVMEAQKLVQENWVHIDRTRRDLEWEPLVNHAEGMSRSMDYIRSLYDKA